MLVGSDRMRGIYFIFLHELIECGTICFAESSVSMQFKKILLSVCEGIEADQSGVIL